MLLGENLNMNGGNVRSESVLRTPVMGAARIPFMNMTPAQSQASFFEEDVLGEGDSDGAWKYHVRIHFHRLPLLSFAHSN